MGYTDRSIGEQPVAAERDMLALVQHDGIYKPARVTGVTKGACVRYMALADGTRIMPRHAKYRRVIPPALPNAERVLSEMPPLPQDREEAAEALCRLIGYWLEPAQS